jgi:hypothetical protein
MQRVKGLRPNYVDIRQEIKNRLSASHNSPLLAVNNIFLFDPETIIRLKGNSKLDHEPQETKLSSFCYVTLTQRVIAYRNVGNKSFITAASHPRRATDYDCTASKA